jgi:transcription termination factor Rho
MNKSELESKHIAELHALAAEANVPRYRMLRREELIEALANGSASGGEKKSRGQREPRGGKAPSRERPQRRRRERPSGERPSGERGSRRRPADEKSSPEPAPAEPKQEPVAETPAPPAGESASARPRRRRRRRFGRRSKGLRVQDLLMPPPGRQALVYGESREACTALLREVAADLAGASDGPDPIALLIDPSPEELADWKREAPQAELVAAGQVRHASDALAQAARRAEAGEDVILLVDSLTRLEDAEVAKQIFDGALTQASGSLTVVAALERSA